MPNFVFCLLCVSSADVDLLVNGGWDQPECGVTFNLKIFLLNLQNLNPGGKICNFLIIYTSIIVLKFLNTFKYVAIFCFKVLNEIKPCTFKNSLPDLASYKSALNISLHLSILETPK